MQVRVINKTHWEHQIMILFFFDHHICQLFLVRINKGNSECMCNEPIGGHDQGHTRNKTDTIR